MGFQNYLNPYMAYRLLSECAKQNSNNSCRERAAFKTGGYQGFSDDYDIQWLLGGSEMERIEPYL